MTEPVPPALVGLVDRWRAAGSPAQDSMAWPRDRWVAQFPQYQVAIRSLPDCLDRQAVRAACRDAGTDADAAQRAFLAVMAWGYGRVGYGPHRAHRVLSQTPHAATRLARVVTRLAEHGPLAGYRLLSIQGECRLQGLGPAFGTKYLYFCQPPGDGMRALILDRYVAEWLRREGNLDVDPVPWRLPIYRRYLEHMHRWASALQCEPDEVEQCVFRAMATEAGSQWG